MNDQILWIAIFSLSALFFLLILLIISYKSKIATRIIGITGIVFGLIYIIYRAIFTFPDPSSFEFVLAIILFITEAIGFFQSIIFKTFYGTRKISKPDKDVIFIEPPTLDVIICTYNEPLYLLSRTILSALRLNWPKDRLKVYVGDDGRREEIKEFCDKVGAIYITRADNVAAKAGNINNVLKTAKGEFFLLLDADMIPKKTIAKEMLPYFQDHKTGFVQSPQVFYNYDVYQHNLNANDRVPNEQDFFMRTMMEKRAVFNAVLHVGSNAIFRRTAIDDIGGIPTGSITEDMATGMLIQAKGYKSFYINKTLAVGRSVETIGDFIKQRDRWLRGSLQVARRYNPLTLRGLKMTQRILYFDGIMYWTFGLQKMVYILAPFIYLFFGIRLFNIYSPNIALFFFPYFISNVIYFRRVSDEKRNLTWSHVYDIALAPQMAWSFIKSAFTGKGLKFNVTPKNVHINKSRFNWKLAWPQLVLMAMTLAGLGFGINLLFKYWNTTDIWAAGVNIVWCIYNGLGIAISLFVFRDLKESRRSMRMRAPFTIADITESVCGQKDSCQCKNRKTKNCGKTIEISDDGAELSVSKEMDQGKLLVGKEIAFTINGIGRVGAKVKRRVELKRSVKLGVEFDDVDFETITNISQFHFSRRNKYVKPYSIDKHRNSFFEILSGAIKKR